MKFLCLLSAVVLGLTVGTSLKSLAQNTNDLIPQKPLSTSSENFVFAQGGQMGGSASCGG